MARAIRQDTHATQTSSQLAKRFTPCDVLCQMEIQAGREKKIRSRTKERSADSRCGATWVG